MTRKALEGKIRLYVIKDQSTSNNYFNNLYKVRIENLEYKS